MNIGIREQLPGFAGEVSGIDLTVPVDPLNARALRDAIARCGVLVFHDQHLTDEQQIAVANLFGTSREAAILDAKIHRARRLSLPQMVDVSNLDATGMPRRRDDRQRMMSLGNRLWHTDSSFEAVRAAYSLLSGRVIPPGGGETELADLRTAYDDLPADMKRHLEGLIAEHWLIHSRTALGFDGYTPEERAAVPPVHWPVVDTHLPSGRKTLYLGSHASHILGWLIPEGRMLLQDLVEFATQRKYVYTHVWRDGDLIVWDNRCTMHRVRPYDELQVRDVRRVSTIDVGVDRL